MPASTPITRVTPGRSSVTERSARRSRSLERCLVARHRGHLGAALLDCDPRAFGDAPLSRRLLRLGTPAETHTNRSLQSLPSSWATAKTYRDGPLSAYVSAGSITPQPPSLSVSPSTLTFSAFTNGTLPAPASLNVSNLGGGNLAFATQSDAAWLKVTPTGGTAPQTLTVSVDQTGLNAGTFTGHVTVNAGSISGSPGTIPVTMTVSDPPPPPPPGSSHDWPMVDHDPMRSGNSPAETTLSTSNVPNLGQLWVTPVNGKVTAQPLYLANVMVNGQAHDVVIAATAQNSLYALDANTGGQLWRRDLPTQGSNCAISGGFGITGAPVVDRVHDRVYAVSDDGLLRSISLSSGVEAAPAVPVIDRPSTNKVWGGLNLVGGTLYVATASDGCDTAPWRGRVYKIDVSGTTPSVTKTWVVVSGIADPNGGGGIWGYGGVSVDTGTGNVFATPGADSNEVYSPFADRLVALDSNLNVLGSYAPFHPSSFPCVSAPCDVDFGATPAIFQPSGCPTLLAAGNKNGNLTSKRRAAWPGALHRSRS